MILIVKNMLNGDFKNLKGDISAFIFSFKQRSKMALGNSGHSVETLFR